MDARKKQYEYYRNELLIFDENVESVTIESVANVKRGVRVVKSQLKDSGYPVYQNCLSPMGYFEKANCPAGCTFVICGGAAGGVGYTNCEAWAADDCEFIIPGERLNSKFVYHYLLKNNDYLKTQVRKASIPRLSPNVIKHLAIPVPSLVEQERIVSILDKFEALVNDLTAGLPAEIAAVEQQYEYYRNKLLTFERAN